MGKLLAAVLLGLSVYGCTPERGQSLGLGERPDAAACCGSSSRADAATNARIADAGTGLSPVDASAISPAVDSAVPADASLAVDSAAPPTPTDAGADAGHDAYVPQPCDCTKKGPCCDGCGFRPAGYAVPETAIAAQCTGKDAWHCAPLQERIERDYWVGECTGDSTTPVWTAHTKYVSAPCATYTGCAESDDDSAACVACPAD